MLGRRDAEDLVRVPLAELVPAPPELDDAAASGRQEDRRPEDLGDDGERPRRELEPDRREGPRRRRREAAPLDVVDDLPVPFERPHGEDLDEFVGHVEAPRVLALLEPQALGRDVGDLLDLLAGGVALGLAPLKAVLAEDILVLEARVDAEDW